MTTIVNYSAGSYGTFIEWILTYLTDPTLSDTLPFQYKGNSHNFKGHFVIKNKNLAETMVFSHQYKFARTHPTQLSIDDLLNDNHTVINTWWTSQSMFWIWNNRETKISIDQLRPVEVYYNKKYAPGLNELLEKTNEEKFKYLLLLDNNSQNTIKEYGLKDSTELVKWQLREILSYWNWSEFDPIYFSPQGPVEKPGVYNLNIEQLRDNFKETLLSIINNLGITPVTERVERLDEIHQSWLKEQVEAYKDQEIKDFIEHTIQGTDFTISRLNFWEEAWIQQQLRNQGYEIKCDGLDNFPTSSFEMNKLIYDNSTNTERT